LYDLLPFKALFNLEIVARSDTDLPFLYFHANALFLPGGIFRHVAVLKSDGRGCYDKNRGDKR
jgi:hypothetical protein